jgi:ubiquinone/menaquinone biosynthesis C-methylase UbiE
VDSSRVLIEAARSASEGFPAAEFIQANIQNLPFTNGFLDSCKVDRTLQHVERPRAVLSEIFRTVHSGGIVVCAEPDWETFAISGSDDAQQTIGRQVARTWSESFRNPRIGHELRQLLVETGFVSLQLQHVLLSTVAFESSDIVFDIAQSALRLAASSGSDEPLAWLAKLQRDRTVCCSVTLVINFAKRP